MPGLVPGIHVFLDLSFLPGGAVYLPGGHPGRAQARAGIQYTSAVVPAKAGTQ